MQFPRSYHWLTIVLLVLGPSAAKAGDDLAAILARIQAPQFAQRDFSVVDYGAVAETDCTAANRKGQNVGPHGNFCARRDLQSFYL